MARAPHEILATWGLAAALLVGGCARSSAPAEAEPERRRPAPTTEPAPTAESMLTVEDRFRARYVSEVAITEDEGLREWLRAIDDPDKADDAYEALRKRKDALPALRAAVWHTRPNVRTNAARILVKWDDHDPATADALIDVLLHDRDEDVRANVARALVSYKDSGVTDALILVLETDPNPNARENAAWALGAVGDKKSIDALIASLDDEDTRVRLRSVSALRKLKARVAIPALVERVRDKNDIVRERAVQTLRELTGKKLGQQYELWKRATGG